MDSDVWNRLHIKVYVEGVRKFMWKVPSGVWETFSLFYLLQESPSHCAVACVSTNILVEESIVISFILSIFPQNHNCCRLCLLLSYRTQLCRYTMHVAMYNAHTLEIWYPLNPVKDLHGRAILPLGEVVLARICGSSQLINQAPKASVDLCP